MLLVHSKNLLLVGNTEFLLIAYLSGISSSWPGHWQWQIQGRGPGGPTPPPPLFFDQNEAQRAKKIFFPLSEGLDPPLTGKCKITFGGWL